MRLADIKAGDVLVSVDSRGAGYYKVVKVNAKTLHVIGENGNPIFRAYAATFDRKVTYPVAAFEPVDDLPDDDGSRHADLTDTEIGQ